MSRWFEADKLGLRQIAERLVERRGFGILGAELYQNVMDTSATACTITLEKKPWVPAEEIKVPGPDEHALIYKGGESVEWQVVG